MAGNALNPSPREMIERLTLGQRAGLVLAFAVTVGGLLLMSRLGGNGPMALLFSDLDANAAASAIGELEARGIPYELTDGGRAIQVPADQVLDLRVDLSASGMVAPTDGWSVLDNQGITASDFDQRVGFQRALEGELGRTIASIDGVSAADVHLVMPKTDLFTGDDVMPTASVLLQTGGATLTSSQVRAVVNLVANSVEGLNASNVSVTDEQGRPLASPEGGISAGGDVAMEQQAAFESSLTTQIQQLLNAVAGPGNAVASVSANLDFDSSRTVSETWGKLADGENPLVLNESVKNEVYTGPGNQVAAGILGPEDQVTNGAAAGDTQGVDYNLDESDTNYALDKFTTETESAPGSIRSLSVAVVVNENAVDAAAVADLEALVGAAVGYNPDRGDTLALTVVPFDEQYVADSTPGDLAFTDPAADAGGLSSMLPLIRMGIIGAVALIATLLFAFFAFRGRKGPQVVALKPSDLDSDDPDLEAIGAAAVAALGTGEEKPQTTDLIALIESQPDDVAGMLRSWMAEDEAQVGS